MKITKEQLKQIIKEELEAVQAEQAESTIEENYGEERHKKHEAECSEMIQQALNAGQISHEEAFSEFARCIDERRMGGA
jgi:hypothetical protein